MLRLVVALLLLSSAAQAGDFPTPVWYFTDSYGDEDSAFAGLQAKLNAYGWSDVRMVGKAGAEMLVSTGQTECTATDNYPMHFASGLGVGCNTKGIYQMKRHPVTGACESFTSHEYMGRLPSSYIVLNATATCDASGTGGDLTLFNDPCCDTSSCVPTCLEDVDPSPSDLCVISFGTNDTAQGEDAEWDTEDVNFTDFIRDYEAAVAHASSYGLRCVLTTGIPYQRTDRTWNVVNARFIAAWIRDTLRPQYPEHQFVDMLAIFDEYGLKKGATAQIGLYRTEEAGDGTLPFIHPEDANANSEGDIGQRWYARHIHESLVGLAREQ